MENNFTSIKKLTKCAGIKSMSEDCFDVIKHLINVKVEKVCKTACMIMTEEKTKTLSSTHVHHALELLNDEHCCKIEK